MGFNIKNNYGPNIEVKDGGRLTLVQGKDGLWNTTDIEDAEEVSGETGVCRDDAELAEKLRPIFYNNETDVKVFLKEISGMQPNNITDLVNTWVKNQRISNYGNSRKGVLWKILNDAGLYTKSRQNWCRRVY